SRSGRQHDRRPSRPRRPGAPPAAPGQGRHVAPRPRPRDRPARARDAGRAHLDLHRRDLRAGHRRPRTAPRRAAADGDPARRTPDQDRPGGADGDPEGALPRLRDPQPLVDAPGGPRRRRDDRRDRLRATRPRARRSARPTTPRRSWPLQPGAVPPAGALVADTGLAPECQTPQPPPPGVSIVTTSPVASRRLVFAGTSSPFTKLRPGRPEPPP